MFAEVEAQHNELTAALRQLEPRLAHGVIPDAREIAGMRRTFAELLQRHVAYVESFVFPRILLVATPEQKSAIERMQGETRQLMDAYQRHISRFKTDAETVASPEYRASTTLLMRMTQRLMTREQNELYPILRIMMPRAPEARPAGSAPPRSGTDG